MPPVISTLEVYTSILGLEVPQAVRMDIQSASLALNSSGVESSSWKTDLDRSTLPAGGEGMTSPALATSNGTGLAFFAWGGGTRASEAAVRCSAV
mgnify:CR=1 FL=1|jgi:hypothetical protein